MRNPKMITNQQILFVALFLYGTIAIGQQLSFNSYKIDSIKIASNLSGYHFDSAGTTTGIPYICLDVLLK